jgi:hypothetical protein
VWLWNIGASHRLFGCICVVVLIQIESGIYNKYYLKHSTIVNHKPTFVMAKRDPILDTIEKRVKEDTWKQSSGCRN